MDSELSKVLIALVAVGGTALGAWLNQRGTRRTAEFTLAGQMEAARVKDYRDEQSRRLAGLRERVNRRLGLYKRITLAAAAGDDTRAMELLLSMHGQEEDLFADLSFMSVPDAGFQRSVQRFMDTDGKCRRTSRELLDRYRGRWGDVTVREEAIKLMQQQVVAPLNESILGLHRAADEAVYSSPAPGAIEPSRVSFKQRIAGLARWRR